MTFDLFDNLPDYDRDGGISSEPLAPGASVLRRFARAQAGALLDAVADVAAVAPFRHLVTPGSVKLTFRKAGREGSHRQNSWPSDANIHS